MRRIVVIICLYIFVSTHGVVAQGVAKQQVPADYGYKVKIGQQVPDFEMELTDGKKVKMKDLRGRVVMLQFTASWCGVCRKEMPHIEKERKIVYMTRLFKEEEFKDMIKVMEALL